MEETPAMTHHISHPGHPTSDRRPHFAARPDTPSARPIRRDQFLHRVGPSAWLLTVDTFQSANGTRTHRRRFTPYPGL
jgi:hypothetical protein